MHNYALSLLHQIKLISSSDLLIKFLNDLKLTLQVLNITDYLDPADGIRRFLKLEQNLRNDQLINQVIAILAVIYFYKTGINYQFIKFQLGLIKSQSIGNADLLSLIEVIEYFINNFEDIASLNKELDIHRKKLILMERVNKFIDDSELRDKTVDLMLLMAK